MCTDTRIYAQSTANPPAQFRQYTHMCHDEAGVLKSRWRQIGGHRYTPGKRHLSGAMKSVVSCGGRLSGTLRATPAWWSLRFCRIQSLWSGLGGRKRLGKTYMHLQMCGCLLAAHKTKDNLRRRLGLPAAICRFVD